MTDHKVVVQNDYSFIAEGVKLTQEVADYLKDTVETRVDKISNIVSNYGLTTRSLSRYDKHKSSSFQQWDQKPHCKPYYLYP
jgi:hypothetical protein